MRQMLRIFPLIFTVLYASEGFPLERVNIDRHDIAAQQRGAQIFFNYCSGCHSLKYVRYDGIAKQLKLLNEKKQPDKDLIQNYLNFTTDNERSPILAAYDAQEMTAWFGKEPPDLSLVIRQRGAPWFVTYLKSFYRDDSRPFGVNNAVFPDVGMPHVLVNKQGLAEAVKDAKGHVVALIPPKDRTPQQIEAYDRSMNDLLHFMDYVSEPHKQDRLNLGVYVVLFMIAMCVFNYLYYREVWKDIPKTKK